MALKTSIIISANGAPKYIAEAYITARRAVFFFVNNLHVFTTSKFWISYFNMNNHFYYNWDGPSDQNDDDYQPGTLFRRRFAQQLPVYPTYTPPIPMQLPNYQNYAPTNLGDTMAQAPPSPLSLEPSSSSESTKTQRWSHKEEEALVQEWKDKFTRLESRHSRVVWEEIAKSIGKTVSQCKRKMQYLKDKYKEAKDHNRYQTGGERKTSPFYDEMDSVLGCRDVVTLQHVVETKSSEAKDSKDNKEKELSNKPSKGKSIMKAATRPSQSSSPSMSSGTSTEKDDSDADKSCDDDDTEDQDIFRFPKSTNKKRGRRERKKVSNKSSRKAVKLDDEEDDPFAGQINSLQQQGDKLNNLSSYRL